MTSVVNRAVFGNEQVGGSFDEGTKQKFGEIRVKKKVFPTIQLANATSVPADVFNPEKMSITEGLTRTFIELAVEFPLTNGQVNDEPTGATAIILSKMAARSLALAEDMVLLQGEDAKLPHTVRIESGAESVGNGILGLVSERKIVAHPPNPGAPTNSGGEILAAIASGIAMLTKELQAPAFALILDTNAYATTWGSVINGAPAYTVLNPVLTGGIYGTGAMPPKTGRLIALGGDPTTIYISSDPETAPTHQGNIG